MKISINIKTGSDTPVNLPLYDGWRGKYTDEGGNYNPPGMPGAIPSQFNLQKVAPPIVFTEAMQMLALGVMQKYNHIIDAKRASMVFDRNIMMTNTQGWGWNKDKTEYIHRKNYFLNQGLDAEYSKLEDAIICSGSFYKLEERADGHLWAIPGWSGIDVNQPLPDVDTVFANGWYFYCTSNTTNPSHFPQGWDGADYFGPVIVPYFLCVEVPYTKSYFDRWQADTLPDPLRIYL